MVRKLDRGQTGSGEPLAHQSYAGLTLSQTITMATNSGRVDSPSKNESVPTVNVGSKSTDTIGVTAPQWVASVMELNWKNRY